MMVSMGVAFVISAAFLEAVAHIAFKVSVSHARLQKILWVVWGVLFFMGSIAFYTHALQRLEIVVAYPLDALSYVFAALLARLCLKERINRRRRLGILLIALGAALALP